MTNHRVSVIRTPHTAEPCYGQCHDAMQSAVGEAEAVAAERRRIRAAVEVEMARFVKAQAEDALAKDWPMADRWRHMNDGLGVALAIIDGEAT